MTEIVKADIKEIYETIKTMLRYAMALIENPIPEMYELGHYLADNILTKVCLTVAIDKGEEQQIYTSRGLTKPFPELYKDHLKYHYTQLPDYDPNIKEFHEDRNVYQHKIESFDRTMRQPRAKAYVNLVEEIMKMIGIIKSGEIIRPANLNPFGASDLSSQQDKTLEAKYRIKELICALENYENIKSDVGLEKKAIQELAILFTSLVTANIGFIFPADARLNHIKNDNYEIIWYPTDPNPTTMFLIRRMENQKRMKEPEEAYYSKKYFELNPDLKKKCDLNVLNEFIEYIKEKNK